MGREGIVLGSLIIVNKFPWCLMEPYRAMSEIYLYLACTREDEKNGTPQSGPSSKCVLSCKVIMFNGRGEIRKTVNREDRRLIKFII